MNLIPTNFIHLLLTSHTRVREAEIYSVHSDKSCPSFICFHLTTTTEDADGSQLTGELSFLSSLIQGKTEFPELEIRLLCCSLNHLINDHNRNHSSETSQVKC